MAEELEMHADLVRAAGVDLRLHMRGGDQPFQHAVAGVRTRLPASSSRTAMRLRCAGMPRNGGADFAGVARDVRRSTRAS